jgi:(p)ppGpp synthase/HD superfamily hydrolase
LQTPLRTENPVTGITQARQDVATDCSNLREMVAKNGERVIEVEWGQPQVAGAAVYQRVQAW